MSQALNLLTAPDNYTPAATIEGVPIHRVLLDVANQAIYWNLKLTAGGVPGGQWDGTEVLMFPGSKQIIRPGIVGVRVRALNPAASIPAGSFQAVVTVEAVT